MGPPRRRATSRKGGEILPAGKRLLPQDTGLAASVGIKTLPVYRKVQAGPVLHRRRAGDAGRAAARPGASTTPTASRCAGWREVFGCELRDYGIVPDSLRGDARGAARARRAECDLIVTSGGVSVGDADYVKPAVEAEGKLLMWRIAMKPGRPLAFGKVGRRRSSSACPATRSRASSPS